MTPLSISALIIGLIGHIELWILFWNHNEASGRSHGDTRFNSRLIVLCFLSFPVLAAGFGWTPWTEMPSWDPSSLAELTGAAYIALCVLVALTVTPLLMLQRFSVSKETRSCLTMTESRVHSFARADCEGPARRGAGENLSRLLLRLPGNQSLQIEQNEKELSLCQLPADLTGLTIAHLSDFHLTGRVGKKYFERAIDLTNAMNADLVAITGDLLDSDEYASWLPHVFGRLQSRLGNYYVLGNHDLKNNVNHLRSRLADAGLIAIGGNWLRIPLHGCSIILAGNELPWIGPLPDMRDCGEKDERQFRVLLSHTPDQLAFAREQGFDLMLAGHTHAGQIKPPLVGPLVCPCQGPLCHAEGIVNAPPTVLHVSRGLSAEFPVRYNCRPEISKLVLRSTRSADLPHVTRDSPTFTADNSVDEPVCSPALHP